MRVLITTDTVGGVWRFVQELASGLLEAGDSVALISFGSTPSAAQCAECLQLAAQWGGAFRYTPSDLPLEWMQENELCFEAGSAVICQVAEQFGPELLHANQYCFGAVELDIPRVVTAHSDVLSWARACRGALEETPWLSRYCALVQRGLSGANVVTAPTRWMLDALGEGFSLACESCVIPNGRRIHEVPATRRRLQVVTAGRLWDEAKDVALLENVCSPMPLMVAGATEHDGSAPVRLRGVKHLGALTEQELLRIFSESAVYACTSRYEPFGLAPLEAALCGCAVVARRIEPMEEVWSDAALYFRDARELSELLTWLYDDRKSLHRAQERAFTRASLYTREAMTATYRSLYSKVTEMDHVA
jgi:glycosyltransferase involved in cell wall biosynthesis